MLWVGSLDRKVHLSTGSIFVALIKPIAFFSFAPHYFVQNKLSHGSRTCDEEPLCDQGVTQSDKASHQLSEHYCTQQGLWI